MAALEDRLETLEEKLECKFNELGLDYEDEEKVRHFLDKIKAKHKGTYRHSLRTGLISLEVASIYNFNPGILFCAGLLHDIGKIWVPDEVVQKTDGNGDSDDEYLNIIRQYANKFTEEDYEKMKKHSIYGYLMLKDALPLIAEIILRHHSFSKKPYPEKFPKSSLQLSEHTKDHINAYARIIGLVDFYDALMTRNNSSEYSMQAQTMEEKVELMLKENSDVDSIVKDLYKEGIFGSYLTTE